MAQHKMKLTMVVETVDLANQTLVLVAAPHAQDPEAAAESAEKDDILIQTSPIILGIPDVESWNVGDHAAITVARA
jgi:hypothetical protein